MARRTDVVWLSVGTSRGTGFAIAPDRVLTSLHVVGKVVDGELRLHGDTILINAAIAGRPADLTITMHVCRGNFRSTWISSGG